MPRVTRSCRVSGKMGCGSSSSVANPNSPANTGNQTAVAVGPSQTAGSPANKPAAGNAQSALAASADAKTSTSAPAPKPTQAAQPQAQAAQPKASAPAQPAQTPAQPQAAQNPAP